MKLAILNFFKIGEDHIDIPLISTIIILCMIGLSVLYSGSTVTSQREFGDPMYFVKKQAVWLTISFVAFLVFANLPFKLFEKYSIPLIILSIFSLVLVFIPGVGKYVATSYGRSFHRWIGIGPFQFQPSEFAKIVVLIYLSSFIVRIKYLPETNRTYRIYILPTIALVIMVFLIMVEPAFGTAIQILIMILFLIFINGFSFKKIILLFITTSPLIFLLVYRVGYRKKRIDVWLDPYKYRYEEGHQLVSSFKAFLDGGWSGNPISTGYSHRYLTYSHTDFIMATFVEDFGFVGFFIVLFLFLFLIIRGFLLVKKVKNLFGFFLGIGIISMISIQVIINLFVVTGIFPITGISLPFISYGGSSLLTILISLGILTNITKKENLSV